jgi:chromosome segregation and condensation protein ScpB
MSSATKKMTPDDWRRLAEAAFGGSEPLSVAEMAEVTHLAPSTVRKIVRDCRKLHAEGKTILDKLAETNEVLKDVARMCKK